MHAAFSVTIFLLLVWARGNIWDNIVSGSFAPYLYIPANFLLILTDNATFFKPELGLAVSSDSNTIMLSANLTFGSSDEPLRGGKLVYAINQVLWRSIPRVLEHA